jgi:hypothetical protein
LAVGGRELTTPEVDVGVGVSESERGRERGIND